MQRMGREPILCVCVCITIDPIQNFDTNVDTDAHANVTCIQSLTDLRWLKTGMWGLFWELQRKRKETISVWLDERIWAEGFELVMKTYSEWLCQGIGRHLQPLLCKRRCTQQWWHIAFLTHLQTFRKCFVKTCWMDCQDQEPLSQQVRLPSLYRNSVK